MEYNKKKSFCYVRRRSSWMKHEDLDCMEMKHRIQEQIHEETKRMTIPEKIRHFRDGAGNGESGYLLEKKLIIEKSSFE
jgi:hypothetical protein